MNQTPKGGITMKSIVYVAGAVLALPDVRERLASQGVDAGSSTPEEFARRLASVLERWAEVVQRLGLRVE